VQNVASVVSIVETHSSEHFEHAPRGEVRVS